MAFSNRHGFFSLDHARWKAWATPQEVVKLHVANMYGDSTGLIWVSTYEGDIITMDRGTVVDYPVKPDSPLRNVRLSPSVSHKRYGQAVQVVWF